MASKMSYSSALSGKKDQAQPDGQQTRQPTQNTSTSQDPRPQHASQQQDRPQLQQQHRQQQQQQSQPRPQHRQQQQHQDRGHQQQNSGAYTRETYVRRASQTPNTSHQNEVHYIVSLTTTPQLHKTLTSIRDQHFPKHLNKLQSHLALFRALPGSQLPRITSDIEALCQQTQPFELYTASSPFRLRQGVGIKLVGGKQDVVKVFKSLEGPWEKEGWLSQQDRGFQPHWTVQNKVDDDKIVDKSMREVEEVLKKEGSGERGVAGKATGLTLFRYEKGYWKFERNFRFGAGNAADATDIGAD